MGKRPEDLYNELRLDLSPYLSTLHVEECGFGIPAKVKLHAANRLLSDFAKKFVESGEKADAAAAEIFRASNDACRQWVPPPDREDVSESDLQLYGTFLKIMDDFFHVDLGADVECLWSCICENARSGPGSAIGANGFSFYAKHFSSRMAATSESLVNIYQAHCLTDAEHAMAEKFRDACYGSPEIVRGSRTSFAPKTADVSRMICVEPSINMYLQLGLGSLIEKRLRRFFSIDLSTQPAVNRWLAKMGSERPDDERSPATIDLSSASDRISLRLASACIPAQWLNAMLVLRSARTRLGKSDVELMMLSTMGNGFTFPMQTALFSCVVAACVAQDVGFQRAASVGSFEQESVPKAWWSVFGDDIIVERRFYARVHRLLDLLGLVVNAAKSFQSGLFRESCGHDYYDGHNVRPVYVRKLRTNQDFAVLINLFNEWTAKTGIPLPRTCTRLWSWLKVMPPLVPFEDNMNSGVRIPFSLLERALKLGSAKWIGLDGNLSIAYRRWQVRPPKIRIGEGTLKVPKGQRRLAYNPSGLMLAYLRGEIRGSAITVKGNRLLPYDAKTAVSPRWDWQQITHEERVFGLALDKQRWNTAVVRNIGHLPGVFI